MKPGWLKLLPAIGLIGVGIALLVRFYRDSAPPGELAFFYDQSAKKLFTASSLSIPPIRGVDGPELDAAKSVVYSQTPADKRSWKIAYLEKCSDELKQELERAQTSGQAPSIGRAAALNLRFVKRPEDKDWVPMSTPAAETILTGWNRPGPDGEHPTICVP